MSAVSQVPPGARSNTDNSAVRDSITDPIELEQLSYSQALIQKGWRWIKGLQAIFTDLLNDAAYFSEWVIRGDMTPHDLPAECIFKDQNGAISTLIRKNSY